MKKSFNITGVCFPHIHYVADTSEKLRQIMEMVQRGDYFVINRPRQYGKSTMLYNIGGATNQLEGFLQISMNFQGLDSKWHESDEAFTEMFLSQIKDSFEFQSEELFHFITEKQVEISDMNSLSRFITRLVHHSKKKLVLIIDEVDACSDFAPFLRFLGMLRTKYLARFSPQHATFQSVVLAGVHDIKTLKYKLRNPEETKYESPWNIAADFDVRMSFNSKETASMLEEYSLAEGVKMNIGGVADRLYFYTSGYPFLVSALCKIIAEKLTSKKVKKVWSLEDIESAVKLLLREPNTNFESLIKNLEINSNLYDLVHEVLVDSAKINYNIDNPLIHKGVLYGIFKQNTNTIEIHNRIYAQRIYNYLSSKIETGLFAKKDIYLGTNTFINTDQTLNIKKVLIRFQQFMKEQYSQKMAGYLEKEWRVLFLAFLKPIINGKGHDFKEPQISEERRLDIVVTFYEHKYVMELKIWRGAEAHKKGLDQLADYLNKEGLEEGFLLIFDERKKKTWQKKEISHRGKDIFAVWV